MSVDDATSTGSQGDGGDDKAKEAQPVDLIKGRINWIRDELQQRKRVTKAGFRAYAEKNELAAWKARRREESADFEGTVVTPGWSQLSRYAHDLLQAAGISVKWDTESGEKVLVLEGDWEPQIFPSNGFALNQDLDAKQQIGDLLGDFLDTLKVESAFFGSGSTIFTAGRKLQKRAGGFGPIRRVMCINIPLICYWCQGTPDAKGALNHIEIPGGVLDRRSLRFNSLADSSPPWHPALAIVGADGCVYDAETPQLYAQENYVAEITNRFVRKARHTLIVCIARSKLGEGPISRGRQQDCGPYILQPESSATQKVIITDECPDEAIHRCFRNAGWEIIDPKHPRPGMTAESIQRVEKTTPSPSRRVKRAVG
jgi:hypothetical protein